MSTQQWFYSQNDSVYGPFTLDVLKQMADAGVVSAATQVAIAGTEQWIPLADVLSTSTEGDAATSQSTHIWGNIAGKVSSASGLEKLEGFSVGQLFSEVFRRHTPEQIEEHFSTGTKATTPPLNVVVASWPTPWAFFRLLGVSLGAAFGFYWALSRFQNPLLIPGWMFVGCFGIPFSALVFFLEANILRNVSVYRIMALLFLGGLLSLVFSLFLFEFTKLDQWIGAIGA